MWKRSLLLGALSALPLYAAGAEMAVMLPFSGPNAKAALAVRDGLVAAYYQASPEEKASTALRFHDTPADRPLPPLFAAAVERDTRAVIGPLLKEQVASVTAAPPDLPVLTLNRAGSAAHGVWQLSLSPDDEMPALARQLQQDGIRRVSILMGPDEASDRLRQAFIMAWEAANGEVRSMHVLQDSKDGGISAAFRQLLGGAGLGTAQALVVVTPGLTPQVQTLLPYYRRTPLPVYTVSTAFDEEAPMVQRRDLDGVRLCSLPWNLGSRWAENLVLHSIAPPESGGYNRLMAMGGDAWQLAGMLPATRPVQIAARTGLINLDRDNLIRTPVCMEIQDGKAVELPARNGQSR